MIDYRFKSSKDVIEMLSIQLVYSDDNKIAKNNKLLYERTINIK